MAPLLPASLTPVPLRVVKGLGHRPLGHPTALTVSCPEEHWESLRIALTPGAGSAGLQPERRGADGLLQVRVTDPDSPGVPAEHYELVVEPSGLRLSGDLAGVRHGARTLGQLLRAAARQPGPLQLACMRVEDAPRFPVRGLMLDISRDRVPTMSELFARLELAAELKYNHVQLYTEHTFAYAGHEAVWQDADPLTPEQVAELDAFAAVRGVELCPNQNTFGHMHRWLTQPGYKHLAEAPEGIVHAFAPGPEPFGLCATDPGSLELIDDLIGQLVPCFTSRRLNVGLDETLDLGLDRSAGACELRGKHEVYLDHLLQVHERVRARDRSMLYWADIALEYDQVHGRLPADATPIVWGYEDGHPFEEQVRKLVEAGQRPWVCPGTSSWQGFTGRIGNATANLEEAARVGKQHNLEGYLVSDWGDYGHWQPHPVSLPGFVLGAALAWNPDKPQRALEAALNEQVLEDPTGLSGRALVELGHAHSSLGSPSVNGIATFFHLRYAHEALPIERAPDLDVDGTRRFAAALEAAVRPLDRAQPQGQGAGWLLDEMHWAAEASAWAGRFAAARLTQGEGSFASAIPLATGERLTADLELLVERYRSLWLRRSRPGGLEDSVSKLTRVAALLRGPL